MTYSTISLSSFRWKFRVTSNPKLRQWFHFEGLIISAQSKQEAIYTWYEEGNIWAWDCTQYVPTRPLNNTFPLAWRKSRKKSFSSFVFQQASSLRYELVPILAERRRHDCNTAATWVWGMNAEINVKSCHKSAKSFPLSLFQDSNLESGFLGGFCIDNGSFISILNWVLHTLNRPHCLERVGPLYW